MLLGIKITIQSLVLHLPSSAAAAQHVPCLPHVLQALSVQYHTTATEIASGTIHVANQSTPGPSASQQQAKQDKFIQDTVASLLHLSVSTGSDNCKHLSSAGHSQDLSRDGSSQALQPQADHTPINHHTFHGPAGHPAPACSSNIQQFAATHCYSRTSSSRSWHRQGICCVCQHSQLARPPSCTKYQGYQWRSCINHPSQTQVDQPYQQSWRSLHTNHLNSCSQLGHSQTAQQATSLRQWQTSQHPHFSQQATQQPLLCPHIYQHYRTHDGGLKLLTAGPAATARLVQQLPHRDHSTTANAAPNKAPVQSGLLALLPAAAVPYAQLMRLENGIGTWLLLWPSLWSIALAAPAGQLPDVWIMTLFSAGALLLRGAGCTVNDLWDRELDARVARTRGRPLASGAVKPWQAVVFLGTQLSLGLMILLQLNTYSQILGASSVLLVGSYPLMKRFTYWPQAYLGLTINWGALLGWAAVRGSCDWAVVLPLYASGVCWSLVYDTIYAHQDKRDDAIVGVKSTALLFGARTKPVLAGFATLQVAALTAAGYAADVGPAYYAGVLGMGAHLAWQLLSTNLEDGPACSRTFIRNKWAGAIMFAGCVAGRALV